MRMRTPALDPFSDSTFVAYTTGAQVMGFGAPSRFGSTWGTPRPVVNVNLPLDVVQWIFADRRTLTVLLKQMNDSPTDRRMAKALAYTSKMPLNGRCHVLTDALALKYTTSAKLTSIAAWKAAFGLGDLDTQQALVELIRLASEGENAVFPAAVPSLTSLGRLAFSKIVSGKQSAIAAYKLITRHHDLWEAVVHSDALLRETAVRRGDTIVATPYKFLGGMVECRVSTPFKIRPGSSVVVWRDDECGLSATLVSLGFDSASESLTARFTSPRVGKSKPNGYKEMFEAAIDRSGVERQFYVTTQPFEGTDRYISPAIYSNSWIAGRSVNRELPLFVSLAAAAEARRGA